MDGMLSQDEINALLSGMATPGDSDGGDAAAGSEAAPAPAPAPASSDAGDDILSDMEKDAIGEVANISMGSSATTLYSLVNRKVNITTPVVTMAQWDSVLQDYEKPCVFIQIKYTVGLDGTNILVLKEHDVKVITDLMMGGDGSNTDGELSELHLSAISEAMNQMMGSSATSMSTMLGKMIDISPPEASLVDLTAFKSGGEIASFLEGTFVKVTFRMQIDDLVDSTIMQLYPVDFAKELCDTFLQNQMGDAEPEPAPAPAPVVVPVPEDESKTVRFKRSFVAKIIGSDEDVKTYYSDLKNAILSYGKVRSQINWTNDRFSIGNDSVIKIGMRGKTLVVYLALNPDEFPETVYHQKFAGDTKMYEMTPMMVKVKTKAAVKKVTRLIDLCMERYGAVQEEREPVDYAAQYFFRTDEELLAEGLIKTAIVDKSDLDF